MLIFKASMTGFDHIPFSQIRLVIFDVDGTLYPLSSMQAQMRFKLLWSYLLKPHRWKEVLLLRRYRKERKKMKGLEIPQLSEMQFELVGQQTGNDPAFVAKLVREWMIERPLPSLKQLTYLNLPQVLKTLRKFKIHIAAFSDYPCAEKLEAMNVNVDFALDAAHPAVEALKPHPNGLLYLCQHFNVLPTEVLFIGDLPELDGACAENAGVHYLGVPKQAEVFYFQLDNYIHTVNGAS